MEKVDGHDSYKLKLTFKSGYSFHIWIDAETFLESKIEGTPRRLDGQYRPVEVYFRDYRPVNGVLIPHVLETRVSLPPSGPGTRAPQSVTEKITIDNIVVNPRLDDALFSKPKTEVAAISSPSLTSTKNTRPQ
jgi:hypothetical protein